MGDSDSPPVSPSRGSTPVDYQPGELRDNRFCSYRFVNKEAHLYWLTGWKMVFNINTERSFPRDLNHMPPELLALTSNETQFGPLLMGFQFKASSSITREIYINLMKSEAESVDWVYCRGRWIKITPETIRATLGLPPLVNNCSYMLLKVNPPPHIFQQVLDTLCPNVPGAHWVGDKLPITYLIRPARWIAEFVHNRILGIKHLTVMDYDAVLIIFCLFKGFTVDIPNVICHYFRERKNDGAMKGFGLAGLLTQMAIGRHVDIPSHLRDLRLPTRRKYRKVPCGFEKHARYIPEIVEALPPAAANSTSNEQEHATDFEQDPPVQQAHDQNLTRSQSMSGRIPQDQTRGGPSRPGRHSSAGDGERPNLSGKAGRHCPAEQMDRPRAGRAAGRRSPEPEFSPLSPFEQWATRKIAKQSQELELLRKYVKGMARGMENFFRMEKHGQRAIAKMGRGLEQGLKEVHKVVKGKGKGKGKGLEFPQRYSSSNCPSWQMEVSRPLDCMSVDDDYWTADGSVAQDHNPRPMPSTRSPDRVSSHTEVLASDHTEILPDSPQDSTGRVFPAREQAVVSSGYRAESSAEGRSSGRTAMQQPSASAGQQAGPSRERGHAASGHDRNMIVLSDSSEDETTTMSTSPSRHERDSDYQPYRFD